MQIILKNIKKKNEITYLTLGIMLLFAGLSGLLPSIVISIVVLIGCCILFTKNALFMAFPLMFFYYSYFGMLAGVSVFRIYTILFLGTYIFKLKNGRYRIPISTILPLTIYMLYLTLVIVDYSMQRALFTFIDIVVCLVLCSRYLNNGDNLKSFFKYYTAVALIAFFTGIIARNSISQIETITFSFDRFMATFEDPNYMGFFYTICVFAIITLRIFDKKIRTIIVIVLYAMILSTISITAILINVIAWFVYLYFYKKIKFKTIAIIAVVSLIIYILYNYGLNNQDFPVLGPLCYRISTKIKEFELGNISSATTGRSDLSTLHLEFFKQKSWLGKLFGGTASNPLLVDSRLSSMAHNDYVDLLLNVGIIGSLFMVGTMIYSVLRNLKQFRKTGDELFLCKLMCKVILAFYMGTLTVFLDYRFVFIYFL